MISDTEKMEKYLDGITPPAYEAAEHRRRLRGQVLEEVATRRSRGSPTGIWKAAALVAGLLCAGALVAQVAFQVHRYFFEGRAHDGSYQFSTQPQTLFDGTQAGAKGDLKGVTVVQQRTARVGPEELGTGGVEQMQRDLEEMDSLRQQEARELVGVTDTEVNGHFLGRAFQFKYVLSDGRVKTLSEASSDTLSNATPEQIEKDQEQIAELRRQGQREITTVLETEVAGKVDRTLICLYVLPDGREVTQGEGDPTEVTAALSLTSAQQDELLRRAGLKDGTFLGTVEKQLLGRNFTFEQYAYELSDGTVAIRSEGQPTGPKRNLTEANWSELGKLTKAGTGELAGQYDQEVRGKLFRFEKRRYILSDGTEVIRSRGTPAADN